MNIEENFGFPNQAQITNRFNYNSQDMAWKDDQGSLGESQDLRDFEDIVQETSNITKLCHEEISNQEIISIKMIIEGCQKEKNKKALNSKTSEQHLSLPLENDNKENNVKNENNIEISVFSSLVVDQNIPSVKFLLNSMQSPNYPEDPKPNSLYFNNSQSNQNPNENSEIFKNLNEKRYSEGSKQNVVEEAKIFPEKIGEIVKRSDTISMETYMNNAAAAEMNDIKQEGGIEKEEEKKKESNDLSSDFKVKLDLAAIYFRLSKADSVNLSGKFKQDFPETTNERKANSVYKKSHGSITSIDFTTNDRNTACRLKGKDNSIPILQSQDKKEQSKIIVKSAKCSASPECLETQKLVDQNWKKDKSCGEENIELKENLICQKNVSTSFIQNPNSQQETKKTILL